MECQKIINSLGNIPDEVPRFITKKWIGVHDQSEGAYSTNKQIRFKTSMLRSDLCGYSDAYTVVEGDTTVEARNKRDRGNRSLAFKNNAPFISCISKMNDVLRYYATFKVRKFESLFYKINTSLQKATTCIRLQAEQVFSKNISYTHFFNFWRGFCGSFSMLFPKAPAS